MKIIFENTYPGIGSLPSDTEVITIENSAWEVSAEQFESMVSKLRLAIFGYDYCEEE